MIDFTVHSYRRLLSELLTKNFEFQSFADFLQAPLPSSIVLRHDVDQRPGHSLRFAELEAEMGIRGVYNFRSVGKSWDEEIIRKIASLGHEIGYHYEEMSICGGDHKKAWDLFRQNLDKLRKIAPVSTITMHGSPRSRFDSRDLWKHYDYRELEILGEPYLDVDFSKVFYLTDTGRRWDGFKVSVRDHVDPKLNLELRQKGHHIHSTGDLIRAVRANILPKQVMINLHPQRWHAGLLPWMGEFIGQNTKNVVKRIIRRNHRNSQSR